MRETIMNTDLCTSKINAHSLLPGDAVIIAGQDVCVRTTSRSNGTVRLSFHNGTAVALGLNVPVTRIVGSRS